MSSEHFEHLAEQLSSHPDYRVLRPIKPDLALVPAEPYATLVRRVAKRTAPLMKHRIAHLLHRQHGSLPGNRICASDIGPLGMRNATIRAPAGCPL